MLLPLEIVCTTNKVPVFYKCKDKRSQRSTPSCACIKAEAKCRVVRHGGDGNSQSDCLSNEAPHLRSQKGLWVRHKDEEG